MKINFLNIVNHSILIDEININFLENKQNFVTYGVLNETNSLNNKQEDTISEIFSQYIIKFEEKSNKTITCENNFYVINLKNLDILKRKLPLKCLNTYKFKNENVNFIHLINFVYKNELLDSIYFPFNNSQEQKKILN